MTILKDLTIDQYRQLQKEYKSDNKISKILFVHTCTLVEWKRKNGLIEDKGQCKRSRMSDQERLIIFKELSSKGIQKEFIAERMLFTIRPMNRWIKKMQEAGNL